MENIDNSFKQLRDAFAGLLDEHGLGDASISISAKPLSPDEAIGNPEKDDYPILKGKERMMEASLLEARGHAFTDMYGRWSGKTSEVARMKLKNNFRRALFAASLNAVTRHLALVEKTVHCRDDGPVQCAEACLNMLRDEHDSARITLIGHQPRMLERLSSHFELTVVDMDSDNIGKQFFGVTVLGPEKTEEAIENADVLLVTGTTLVNGSIGRFLNRKKETIFYGVTIAGAAKLLGLRRFCPFGL
jgi:uncharacterized protein (DUF4213/DUF364 family)